MLFAEIDATGWAVIISAACIGVGGIATSVLTLWLSDRRERAKIARDLEAAKIAADAEAARVARERVAAAKVEEVRKTAVVAARAVEEVKSTVAETAAATTEVLAGIAKTGEEAKRVGEAVHVLVNSAMSQQLKIAAVALRRVADLTKHPDDEKAAQIAETGYHEHESKQRIVDRGEKMTPTKQPEQYRG